jgi:hypothetical protein
MEKRNGGMVQAVERLPSKGKFKPQYHQKEKEKKKKSME